MKSKNRLLTVLIVILLNTALYSQFSYRTVVISDKVGDYIDKNENIKYGLFPASDNFKSARIVLRSDNKYFVEIAYSDSTKTDLFDLSKELLLRYTEKIELEDAINDGIYKPGFSFVSADSTAEKLYLRLKNDYYRKLPYVKNLTPQTKFRPLFGIGGGIRFIKPDLGDMKMIYDYIEETVRNNGFPISSNKLDDGPNKFITGNIYLTIYKSLGIYLEAGRGIQSEWDTYYTSGSVKYYFNFKKPDWLKLYAGAGYTKIGFKGTQYYGSAISTTNNGSYWRLDSVGTEANSVGFTLNLGTDIGYYDYKSNFYITFFTDFSYTFFPEKTYRVAYSGPEFSLNKTSKTKFNRFSVSSGIKIYF